MRNSTSLHSAEGVAPGLYIRALCDGMDQALEPFREEIIELERTVLNNSHTPLSLILCNVEKYTCLFSLLHSIIREVTIYFFRKKVLHTSIDLLLMYFISLNQYFISFSYNFSYYNIT